MRRGSDGVITAEESNIFGLESELVEGMQSDSGYILSAFPSSTDCMEVFLQSKISFRRDSSVLEKVIQAGKPPATPEDVEGEFPAIARRQ